jgi:hypothetical protein
MLRELNKARAGFRIRADQAAAAFLGAGDGRPAAVATGNWCAASHNLPTSTWIVPFVKGPEIVRILFPQLCLGCTRLSAAPAPSCCCFGRGHVS